MMDVQVVARRTGRRVLMDDLAGRIGRGALLPGTRLLSTQALAKQYGVSLQTAHNALQELTRRGLLVRRHGDGTFVNPTPPPPPPSSERMVALEMRSDGAIWGAFLGSLLRGLRELDVHPLLTDSTGLDALAFADLPVVRRAIASRPAFAVVEHYGVAELLRRESPSTHVICLDRGVVGKPDYDQVTVDLEEAGRLAVEHLLGQGCRRLGVYHLATDADPAAPPVAADRLLLAGVDAALASANLLPAARLGVPWDQDGRGRIREFLAQGLTIDALLCPYDHRAVEFIEVAADLGVGPPADLAVLSAWNTPYADAYGLTSLDYRYDLIAAKCLKLIGEALAGKREYDHWRCYRVPPQLVVRRSCGETAAQPSHSGGAA